MVSAFDNYMFNGKHCRPRSDYFQTEKPNQGPQCLSKDEVILAVHIMVVKHSYVFVYQLAVPLVL